MADKVKIQDEVLESVSGGSKLVAIEKALMFNSEKIKATLGQSADQFSKAFLEYAKFKSEAAGLSASGLKANINEDPNVVGVRPGIIYAND